MPGVRLTVDDEDSLGGRLGASDVYVYYRLAYAFSSGQLIALTCLQAIDGLVFTLGLVAFGDDRGDSSSIVRIE